MSLYFSFENDEQVSTSYECQCRGGQTSVTPNGAYPDCSECKGTGIYTSKSDAHGFAWSASSASYLLRLIGVELVDGCFAKVEASWATYDALTLAADQLNPTLPISVTTEDQRAAVNWFGSCDSVRERLYQLRDTVLAAIAAGKTEVVGA